MLVKYYIVFGCPTLAKPTYYICMFVHECLDFDTYNYCINTIK